MAEKPAQVLLACIGAAHGIRGEVRVKSFTADPAGFGGYGPLTTGTGRQLQVERLRLAREVVVTKFRGVDDRDAAEALNGVELFVPRDLLPDPGDEDEYYHADLIGLAACGADGSPIGTVTAIHNFGAGDLIDIAPPRGPSLLVPFTREAVPEIDVAAGRLTVVAPASAEPDETDEQDGDPE